MASWFTTPSVTQNRGTAPYNGSPLAVGTYYYIIDPKNGKKPLAGPITIIR